ncbi:MAG: SUKH-4 family immunity protein [Planctomycetes bacterium]|nr:SUKH-4 family immunity protein [Planctomycetota bacterium]
MHTYTPSEFQSRWPGALRPITLPTPPPALPDDCTRLLTELGLPRELAIYCNNDTTLRFSGSLTPLAVIWDRDLQRNYKMGDMPEGWNCFWHIADQEYLQGGGWICIEEISGRMVVIDLDQTDPIYSINSSVANFVTTLAHFLDWSENSGGSPEETIILRDGLLSQNCIPPDELEGFWMNFIYSTLDSDPINLSVCLC